MADKTDYPLPKHIQRMNAGANAAPQGVKGMKDAGKASIAFSGSGHNKRKAYTGNLGRASSRVAMNTRKPNSSENKIRMKKGMVKPC